MKRNKGPVKQFWIKWKDTDFEEVLKGTSIGDALNRAGYSLNDRQSVEAWKELE